MPNHERAAAQAINQSWPVMERYFDTPAWRASGTDPAAIMRGMPWASWTEQAGRVVAPLAAATAAAFAEEAQAIGSVTGHLSFKVVDDVSVKYAQTQGSKLIAAITEAQRATVRTMVAESLQGGWTADQLGRRLRSTVGLHPAWATAVTRYEDKQIKRLLLDGKTPEVAAATAAARAEKKRKHLLKVRGENIARTEIQTASNLGKYATWDSAIGKGFASKDSRKEFSPGPDACDKCDPISGEVVAWDEPFSNGKMMPPFHPGCRCTANILPPDYNDEDLDPDAFDWLSPDDVTDRPTFQPTLANRIGNLANRPAPFIPPAPAPAAPLAPPVQTEAELAEHLNENTILGTPDEQQAAGLYLGGARYNTALRDGLSIDEFTQARIDQLTDLIDKQPALGPAKLYRGTSSAFFPEGTAQPGQIITEPAFLSTSAKRSEAQIFAGQTGTKGGTLMEIETRPRDRGFPVNASRMTDQSGIPEEYRERLDILDREAEILLRPGTSIRVKSVTKKTIDGVEYTYVKADIVDTPHVTPAPVTTPFEAPSTLTPSKASDITLQSTAHMTDDDLNDLLVKLSADDPDAVDKILDIFDQRDVIAAQNAAFDMAEEAREAESKVMGWGSVPEEFLKPTPDAPSRSVSRALTPDEQVSEDFYAYIQSQHARALNDLNGNFFKQQYRGKGFDEFTTLFEGNTTSARKYASEELIAWWEENGRHTKGSFRYGALGRAEDYKRHQRVLREGFGGRMGANRDRSTF